MELLLLLVVPYFLLYIYLFFIISIKSQAARKKEYKAFKVNRSGPLPQPFLTVIIPFRNEAGNLPLIIRDLALQTWPESLSEIVFIDDGSTDGSFAEASRLTSGMNNFRILKNQGSGKKEAIDTAINKTRGELIITTDADCRLNQEWLTGIAGVYSETMASLIIGPVYPHDKPGVANRLLLLESMAIQSVTEATAIIEHPVMASGANLAFTRELAGGYLDFIRPEISSGDDMYLLHRAKRENHKIVFNFSQGSEVYTEQPSGFREFLLQRIRWSSKATTYTDTDTRVLGAVTFFTNLLVAVLLVISLFIQGLFIIAVTFWLIKSVPDFMLLIKKSLIMNRMKLLPWFIPVQALYPFYVSVVSIAGIFHRPRWK